VMVASVPSSPPKLLSIIQSNSGQPYLIHTLNVFRPLFYMDGRFSGSLLVDTVLSLFETVTALDSKRDRNL
jgi:hypothetical protein